MRRRRGGFGLCRLGLLLVRRLGLLGAGWGVRGVKFVLRFRGAGGRGERTALVRKSRCAWVKGLCRGAGLEAAFGPDLGVREGRSGGGNSASFELAVAGRLEVADRRRVWREALRTWSRLGARKS